MPFAYSSASIVGKLESFMYHQGTDKTYLRFANESHKYQTLVLGPTIIAKREVFNKVRFQHLSSGEDTAFLKDCIDAGFRIYASDKFNFIYWRSSNTKDHTWQPDDDVLLNNAIYYADNLSSENIMI